MPKKTSAVTGKNPKMNSTELNSIYSLRASNQHSSIATTQIMMPKYVA